MIEGAFSFILIMVFVGVLMFVFISMGASLWLAGVTWAITGAIILVDMWFEYRGHNRSEEWNHDT